MRKIPIIDSLKMLMPKHLKEYKNSFTKGKMFTIHFSAFSDKLRVGSIVFDVFPFCFLNNAALDLGIGPRFIKQ